MDTFARAFGTPVGLSDHSTGHRGGHRGRRARRRLHREALHARPRAARPGPPGLPAAGRAPRRWWPAIREVEAALGDGVKRPAPSELPVRDVARKSLVAARDLPAGAALAPRRPRRPPPRHRALPRRAAARARPADRPAHPPSHPHHRGHAPAMISALVVGGGSIGKRHLRNLLATRPLGRGGRAAGGPARRDPGQAPGHPGVHATLEEALAHGPYLAGFICLPTAYHLEPALALARRGLHIFMEKPVSHSIEGIPALLDVIEQRRLIGDDRLLPALLQAAPEGQGADRGGPRRAASSPRGASPASTCPTGTPTRTTARSTWPRRTRAAGCSSTSATPSTGCSGSAGRSPGVFAVVGTFSDLEVETDDVCEVIARFGTRAVGSIHLDMVDRSARSEVEIIGTDRHRAGGPRGPHRARLRPRGAASGRRSRSSPPTTGCTSTRSTHFFGCVERGGEAGGGPAGRLPGPAHHRRLRALQRLRPLGRRRLANPDAGRAGDRPARHQGPQPGQGHPPRGPAGHRRSPASTPCATTREGADELLYVDIVASLYGRNSLLEVVRRTAAGGLRAR